MIYLKNSIQSQEIYIPKNEFVPTENKTLEERTVVVNQDVTIVEPSGTYKGLSKVTIDATEYAQKNYDGGFEDGFSDGYVSGSSDGFESGYTSGETHQKSLLASTAFTENGHYTRENGWNEVDVDLKIQDLRDIGLITRNGLNMRFDPDEGYDYMKAVNVSVGIPMSSITITGNTAITVDEGAFTSITVDVPQTGGSFITFVDYVHTDPLSGLTNIYIDTNIFPTTATTMRIKYQGKGLDAGSKYLGFSKRNEEDIYTGATDQTDYRLFTASSVAYWDFNRSRLMNNWQSIKSDGVDYDLTIGNNYVYDHNREKEILSGGTLTENPAPNIPIMVNVSAIWLKSLEIWEGETKVFDGKAAFDNNGRIGLYDSISATLKAQTQDVAMTYEITGSTVPLTSITITENTAITVNDKAYTAITVNVPQTGHTDQEMEEAFESGYTSGHTEGMNDQKQLLTTTAFTENGSYQRENGWSGISVNVDTATTYQNGYNSGVTDGENTIISTFTATTATTNGQYGSSAHPLSSITVNVPQSGQTYNIEQNKQVAVTVTSGGNYTIIPTSGSTTVTDYFDSEYNRYYLTASTQGYPSVGTFYTVKVFDSQDQSKGYLNVGLKNGLIYLDVTNWYGEYPYTLSNSVIMFPSGSNSYTWTPLEYFNISYDAMSAVTFNVSVNTASTYQSGYTNGYNSGYTSGYTSGYSSGHTSGYTDGQNAIIGTFSAMTATTNGVYGSSSNPLSSITVNVDTATTYQNGYNSGYTSGYTDGVDSVDTASTYQSGYTDGYESGYTNGYASGSSQGYNSGLESALYGAYYPVDSATNKSYCTHFPDLENGKMIYFDIISTSRRQANKMLGGDYNNRDEHYLMIGYDNSNNEVDIQINAKGTPSGITTNAYMTLFNPTSGSIVYNPNQRICGEISVTDTECNYGVACLGFVPYKYTVQGDFTGSYPIKFNQDFASAFTLCKVVYKDIATGAFEHYFSYDSNTNEIKDWITGNIAPTYDYNGNRVYGVLESKEL